MTQSPFLTSSSEVLTFCGNATQTYYEATIPFPFKQLVINMRADSAPPMGVFPVLGIGDMTAGGVMVDNPTDFGYLDYGAPSSQYNSQFPLAFWSTNDYEWMNYKRLTAVIYAEQNPTNPFTAPSAYTSLTSFTHVGSSFSQQGLPLSFYGFVSGQLTTQAGDNNRIRFQMSDQSTIDYGWALQIYTIN